MDEKTLYAIAFSYHPSLEIKATLHKYGPADYVRRWTQIARTVYIEGGFTYEGDELKCIEDVPQEELVQCLTHVDYIAKLYEKHIYKEYIPQ